MKEFVGRVAVVTGAASGIGFSTAKALASAGMSVALIDRRADKLTEAVNELRSNNLTAIGIEANVADKSSMAHAAEQIDRSFGKVHILMNNAGVLIRGPMIEEIDDDDWNWLLGVNVMGTLHGIQCFVPRMRAHGETGHVINMASMAGFRVGSGRKTGAYSTSKFAIVALSESLASDLEGTSIGVSIVAPSGVNSGFYESSATYRNSMGKSNEFAAAPADIKANMHPDEVAQRILAGIRENRLYIFTHSNARRALTERHDRIMADVEAGESFRR